MSKDNSLEGISPAPDSVRSPSPVGSARGSLKTLLSEDEELQGLSLYEKKAALANRELDSHGMGRYQWCIWLLCGFGYFIDLLWAQAFGLALVSIIPEFGLVGAKSAQSGNLSTAFNAGLAAGAFVWGFLVDIIGRRWAFNGTVFIASVFGLSLGASNNYTTLLVLAAFCGFGVGGNVPIDTTICLEFLPQNRRLLLAALSLFQPVGTVVSSAIAYAFIPTHSCEAQVECGTQPAGEPCCTKDSNYGWRYFLFTLGGITIFVFIARFLFFNLRESPKYLLGRGMDAEAAESLKQIAAFNKRVPMVTMEHFEALNDAYIQSHQESDDQEETLGSASGKDTHDLSIGQRLKFEGTRVAQLFTERSTAFLTVTTWLIYIFDYTSFTSAATYIPTLLSIKGAQIGVSISETYRNYIIIYSPGILAAVLAAGFYEIPGVGRKLGMVVSSILQGVSLFLFATATTEAAYIGFNVLEYFMQTLFNAILYGWTPEIFPAPIRGTASGMASFFGRLFAIVSPIISARIWASYGGDTSNPDYGNGVLYFAGASVWVATFCVILIPNKQMGRRSF